ncbi:MAG: tRNA glutamyl-Q(34) synthetase GluQRS [Gammaproteobacteria bacterium]
MKSALLHKDAAITGRFAPTPSGPLHFGSLVAALASYCHSKSQQGQWLLRIEDVDTPRVVEGSDRQILQDLETFGFEWDGAVMYQSEQFECYESRLSDLIEQGLCYACECSHRSLRQAGAKTGPLGQIYPGICCDRNLGPKDHSIRIITESVTASGFTDQVFGPIELNIHQQVGDFVLRRADGIYAYHLAVVVDDAQQGINQIVRGADLIESTCLHIYLQQVLGLPEPEYLHIPLIRNIHGGKLSKQAGATAVDTTRASALLVSAMRFLGQSIEPDMDQAGPDEVINHAVKVWDPANIVPEANYNKTIL